MTEWIQRQSLCLGCLYGTKSTDGVNVPALRGRCLSAAMPQKWLVSGEAASLVCRVCHSDDRVQPLPLYVTPTLRPAL
jgi:hypothetical protein